MTIKDIAKIAQVSPATVSRALNNDVRVSAKTRKRVQALASDLNYQPNLMAKGLASQKTYTICVLIPDVTNTFYAHIMRGIEDVLTPHNYSTVYINTDYEAEKERRALDFLKSGRVDGIIAYISNRVIDECAMLVKQDYPLIMLGHMIDEIRTTAIGCNNQSSAYAITEYLIRAGHRRIAHVAGHMETKTAMQRLQGYKRALETYDIPIRNEWIVATDYAGESAYNNALAFLKKEPGITAIFAANDAIAAGCYRAIYELGGRIPEDISVVGHDDTEMATLLRPELTTMHQDIRKIGRLAAQHLFSAMEKGKNTEDAIIVPTRLVERHSVRPIDRESV